MSTPFYLFGIFLSFFIKNKYIYLIYILYLIIFATIFVFYFSPDSVNYRGQSNKYYFSDLINFQWNNVEPGFVFLSAFFNYFNIHYIYVIVCCLILAVTLKVNFIVKNFNDPFFILLGYTSYFFILHEMTQIRAAVALAFGIYAIRYFSENKIARANFFIILSSLFHYSLISFLIFNLFKFYKPTLLHLWIGILLVILITFFLGIISSQSTENLITLLPFSERYFYYNSEQLGDAVFFRLKFFGILFLCIVVSYVFKREINSISKIELFSIYSIFIALIIYCFFYEIEQLQVRLSEIFLFPSIFLIPRIVNQFKPKELISAAAVFIVISINIYYTQYVVVFKEIKFEDYIDVEKK